MAAPIAQHLSNVNRQRLAEIITNSGTWQKGAAIGGKTGRRMTPKPRCFLRKSIVPSRQKSEAHPQMSGKTPQMNRQQYLRQ